MSTSITPSMLYQQNYPMYYLAKKMRSLREEKLSALKSALSNDKNVLIKTKFFVSLPTNASHEKFHPTGIVCGPAQKVHPLISKKIEDLVREGAVDANEVQRSLKEYVKNNSILQPSVTDRSYYPTVNDIRNHMYKARIVLQLSKFDQENLTLKIKEWEALDSGDSHFFRPYIKGDNGKLQVLVYAHFIPCSNPGKLFGIMETEDGTCCWRW